MSKIAAAIAAANAENRKALSVFLTAGFPQVAGFVDLALQVYEAGADLIELGIPFSDPLADGPIIQKSSQSALENGVDLKLVLSIAAEIRRQSGKPLILMGYANPILRFGCTAFIERASAAGVDGLIIPDLPLEESRRFWAETDLNGLDNILLTTPVSGDERIRAIDQASSGFVYCVSVTGTTGERLDFDRQVIENLQRTYQLLQKNNMLIGFGISGPAAIEQLKPWSDGFIVGSAVVKRLGQGGRAELQSALEFIRELKAVC